MTTSFTREEISEIAESLSNGKSAGSDCLQAKYIKYSPGLINQDVTIQPRRAALMTTKVHLCLFADFLFPAKTPQTEGFQISQISHFHRKIASYRLGVVTQNGIRVGSNLHECSRIRNFDAKFIWFISRLTEYRLHLYNTFAEFIYTHHTPIASIEQKTLY